MEKILGEKYILQKKIGQGSFGKIYIVAHKDSNKKFAMKLENADSRVPQLEFEARMYTTMSGSVNVPRLYYNGSDICYNMLVIDLLGKSLEDLLTYCRRRMSLKSVLMLADQMISAVQFFHSKNFIHRDIKPDNFVMGTGNNSNQLYIIDYGLAKRYRDLVTHEHINYIEGKSLTGTARYASINALAGCEQSRRDDMEALAYVWIYLLKGSLPWMGIDAMDRHEKYALICKSKKNTSPEKLCKGLPSEFITYINLVRNLEFTQEPEYAKYREMFRNLMIDIGYTYDYIYDWTDQESDGFIRLSAKPSAGRARRNSIDFYTFDQRSLERIQSVEAVKSGEFSDDDKKKANDDVFNSEEPIDDKTIPVRYTKPKAKKAAAPEKVSMTEGETKPKVTTKKKATKKKRRAPRPSVDNNGTPRKTRKKKAKATPKLSQENERIAAEERKRIEERRLAEEKAAEEQRRLKLEEEERRKQEELRKAAEEAEKKRIEEEQRKKEEEIKAIERRLFEEAEKTRREAEARLAAERQKAAEDGLQRSGRRHRHKHTRKSREVAPPLDVKAGEVNFDVQRLNVDDHINRHDRHREVHRSREEYRSRDYDYNYTSRDTGYSRERYPSVEADYSRDRYKSRDRSMEINEYRVSDKGQRRSSARRSQSLEVDRGARASRKYSDRDEAHRHRHHRRKAPDLAM